MIINKTNSDFINGKANADSLTEEIKATALSNLLNSISINGNSVEIDFSADLTQPQIDILNGIIAIHKGVSPDLKTIYDTLPNEATLNSIKRTIDSAVRFGQQEIKTFTVENVVLGVTQLGLTNKVLTITSKLITCLTTGSLYQAIAEIKAVNPADLDNTILTAARLTAFRNKIEKYLGLTLSSSWDQ